MSTGYLDRHPSRSRSLTIAVAVHIGIIAAVLTVKPAIVFAPAEPPLTIDTLPVRVPPPPPPTHDKQVPKPEPRLNNPELRPVVVAPPPPIDLGPTFVPTPIYDLPPSGDASQPGPQESSAKAVLPPPAPVLTQPGTDSRYARDLQPPYPPAMERLEQEGSVTVRVQIDTDGRVIDVALVRTDADDFFTATKAWALRKWRFRPATRDGTPVVAWLTKTVRFQINH